MILVPSHLQQLSGNRYLILVCLITLMVACSPKTARIPSKSGPVKVKPQPVETVKKPVEENSIALLLPFHLDEIKPAKAKKSDIHKADLAIDFYQGLKLALDSLATAGYNFKLKVFDSQDQETRAVNLARANSVRSNNLIIGPVFPDQVKAFGEFADLKQKLQVSPLAATIPSPFNPNLVTINNTIDQHGWKVADFINRNYKPSEVQIVLINTQKPDDDKFAVPIKNYLKNLSGNKFLVHERPNSIGIEGYLSPSKINLVIVTSSETNFVLPTINRLYALSKGNIKIEVFGHPNWVKAKNMDIEKLQWLNTRITSSYFIDYKNAAVKQFITRYRNEYSLEPSEYAFKGFDTGYYFGKLVALYGADYANHLTSETYEGLHNGFRFKRDAKLGFLNTEVMMLKYQGFELQKIK